MALAIAAMMVLAWQGHALAFWQFEIALALTGIGFGAMPPFASTVLQNSVPIHQFGSAVASMQFSRNLFCTMLVSVFGAIVLVAASGPAGGAPPVVEYSADGFVRLFYAAAASFAVAFVAMVLIEEKPLATTHD
jgi:MFS family permease